VQIASAFEFEDFTLGNAEHDADLCGTQQHRPDVNGARFFPSALRHGSPRSRRSVTCRS
jgi:hypothetical protein